METIVGEVGSVVAIGAASIKKYLKAVQLCIAKFLRIGLMGQFNSLNFFGKTIEGRIYGYNSFLVGLKRLPILKNSSSSIRCVSCGILS